MDFSVDFSAFFAAGGSCPLPAEVGCRQGAVGNSLGGSLAAGAGPQGWAVGGELHVGFSYGMCGILKGFHGIS